MEWTRNYPCCEFRFGFSVLIIHGVAKVKR